MDIELFTASTPNGHKVSIMLEELGLTYKCTPINLTHMQQKQDWESFYFWLKTNLKMTLITISICEILRTS